MIERLISDVGFGWAIRITAFFILFLLIIANLTIRARSPPNPHSMSRETLLQPFREVEMVLVILGFVLLTFGIFVPIDYLVIEAISKGMNANLAQYLVTILNAGRYVYMFLNLGSGAMVGGYNGFLLTFPSLFGRLGAGALADKIGPYNIFVIVCYMAGIMFLALWIPAVSNAAVIVFAIFFGFASGA